MRENILVVEDNPEIGDVLVQMLAMEGFKVQSADSAAGCRALCDQQDFDLYLLDLMLPDHSGLELAREIRDRSDAGIIIVTGRGGETDHVLGLELGADDYVTKPFRPRELLARVNSVLRRRNPPRDHAETSNGRANTVLTFNGWQMDLDARALFSPHGDSTALTTAEYELLKVFVESPRRVHSRDHLLNCIHGREWVGYDRGIDGLVSRLRKKLEGDPQQPEIIKTIRGAGYLFAADVARI